MFCFKELLWISRILQAYIKCSGVCAPSLQGHVGLSVNLNLCKYDFVCVCVCVRERERERGGADIARACVCVRAHSWMHVCMYIT